MVTTRIERDWRSEIDSELFPMLMTIDQAARAISTERGPPGPAAS